MGIREDSHAICARYTSTFIRQVNEKCKGTKAYFRGGESVVGYDCNNNHDLPARTVGEMGLDFFIENKHGKVWCQPDRRAPKHIKKDPKFKYVRTKATSNGVPIDDEVQKVFGNQWIVSMKFFNSDVEEPCMVQVAPLRLCLEAGYGIGYVFPGHKGRRNTIHWYTERTIWTEGYVPGHEYAKEFSSISKTGFGQDRLGLFDMVSMCDVIDFMIKTTGK